MADTSVTIRARMEIEIVVGVWEDKISLDDIRKQVNREAQQIVLGRISKDGVRLMGTPTLTAIMVSDKTS